MPQWVVHKNYSDTTQNKAIGRRTVKVTRTGGEATNYENLGV